MAEDDKTTSAWYKVPTWDGSPVTWRAFSKEMQWWVSSLDLESTKKFNLAARWLLRQSGVVRQRGEEFTPAELEYQKEVRAKDPDGVEIVVTKEDPLAGLNKLLKALEGINGKSALDKKGELRKLFYTELSRKPGERPADFMSRFRFLAAELKSEGIALPSSELGWFLKEKLGLDPLRKQLLETALQGREGFEDVEAEALRLFKDLHAADPLMRRAGAPDLRGRGRSFGGFGGTPSSSTTFSVYRGSGALSSVSGRSSGSVTPAPKGGGKAGSFAPRRPFLGYRSRQAFAAEQLGETEGEPGEEAEDEELVPEEEGNGVSLDDVLEAEAEALATELEQAEAEGLEPQVLDEVEGTVESAAEALLTMREARHKLQDLRKGRGFGKATSAPSSPQSGRPGFKKRGVCHDCGQPGHWAGDQGCSKPGAGLARPKSSARPGATPSQSSPSHRRVQLVESFAAEATQEQREDPAVYHETAVVSSWSSFAEALEASQPHETQSALAVDKRLVGALCGRRWLEGYLQALARSPLWQALQPLVKTEVERENFKFGNDGVKASYSRHRLPMVVGSSCVLVWTSVVEVESLGLLLGRDFLEAIGGVISFTRRALRADHLDASRIPLRQLSAGHFFLDIFPETWSTSARPWRREGQDGILEVQLSSFEWSLRRAAAVKGPPVNGREHEQLAVEQARGPHAGHSGSRVSNSMTKPVLTAPLHVAARHKQGGPCGRAVPKDVFAPPRKKRVALRWATALVAAAALASVRAPAVQQHPVPIGLEGASRSHGAEWSPATAAFSCSCPREQVRGPGVAQGRGLLEGQDGRQSGRSHVGWNAGSSPHQRSSSRDPQPAGGQVESRGDREKDQSRAADRCAGLAGSQGWFAYLETGPHPSGRVAACGGERQRHRREAQNKVAPDSRRASGHSASVGSGGCILGDPGGGFSRTSCTTLRTRRATTADDRAPDGRTDAAADPFTRRDPPAGECNGRGPYARPRQPVRSHAAPDDAAHDDDVEQQRQPATGWGRWPVTGQRHGLPADDERKRAVIPPLRQQLKTGQRLLISQAWNKCKHDRNLLKVSPQNIYEAFAVLQDQIYDNALHEPFIDMAFVPHPHDRAPLAPDLVKLAAARGHAVGQLQADLCVKPYFLMLRATGRSPLLNYAPERTRLAAEKKILDAEASVMHAALAHRRSGRHFLMELLRGADPRRTLEGRELMDEAGLFDFSREGRRYLTSSRVVADAFRDQRDENLVEAVLEAVQQQFDKDLGPEKVTETLAAETAVDDDDLLDGLGGAMESEDEALEPSQDPEKEVPIPASVRQAVRRLHENTGHRSPLRLARALVIAGAPPQAVIAAKQLRCSVCEERRPPKSRRPASLPGPREPGEQVALDIFDAFDAAGARYSVLHAVDGATKFQMAVLVKNKSSAEVVKFIRERWAPVFGMPRTLVCDQGREFISIELENFAHQSNIFMYHTAIQAPWQNALCERVGGLLKTLLSACAMAQSLMGPDEMALGLGEAVQAYNMDVGDDNFLLADFSFNQINCTALMRLGRRRSD